MLPHAALVERRVWGVVEAIIGRTLTDQQMTQVQLPTDCGGLQMPMPTSIAPIARAADLIEVGLPLRQAIVGWGFELSIAKTVDGVNDAVAEGLLPLLAEQRITFDSPGHSVQLRPGDVPEISADIFRLAKYEHQTALEDDRHRTRLLSAGGPTAGKSLVAPAGLKSTHFPDEEFTETLCWRLGVPPLLEPSHCQNHECRQSL